MSHAHKPILTQTAVSGKDCRNAAAYLSSDGWILPLLGIIFLPITTLSYVVVYALGNGPVTGAAWLWVVLGLLFDLGLHSSGYSSNRTRVRRYRTASQ